MGEVRHCDRAAHDKILPRAHIDAHLNDKVGIQLQKVLVHGRGSFTIMNDIVAVDL